MLNQSNSENDRSNYKRAYVIEILLNTRCRPTFSHSTRETDPPTPGTARDTAERLAVWRIVRCQRTIFIPLPFPSSSSLC